MPCFSKTAVRVLHSGQPIRYSQNDVQSMILNTSMLLAIKTQSRSRSNSNTGTHSPKVVCPLSTASINPLKVPRTISTLDVTTLHIPSSPITDFLPTPIVAKEAIPVHRVIGSSVTALPFDAQMKVIVGWAAQRLNKMVCVANAHMLMEAHWNPEFADVLENADIVTSDGMPIVWMMKLLGVRSQERVAGMDILMELCRLSTQQNLKVYFLGCQQSVLDQMKARLEIDFPKLAVAGMEPLPFRPMTREEEDDVLARIQTSGANLVFVSLGCPKQEKWMAQHRSRVNAVMVGLGGAFPVYAGIKKWAPRWVREAGLEWAYRLMQEPRRLAKRYGETNQAFLWLSLKQLFEVRFQKVQKP
jgi:N-acetylglucosaminyldiphosphoundecaprenol N-acetyl-beta-D-mannosaminyltransferase